MEEIHEMELTATHVHSWEEWYCYGCGRHFMLLNWSPMVRVILETGKDIAHQGGKIVKMEGFTLYKSGLRPEMQDALADLDLD